MAYEILIPWGGEVSSCSMMGESYRGGRRYDV